MKKSKFGLAVLLAGTVMTVGAQAQETATAIFAGGCFWSIESDFDHAPGVLDTTSGYIGGHVDNPTYEQMTTETTGHREAVKVTYDPKVTSYEKLLDAYWHMTDPTSADGQFCDFGDSYRPGLFPLDKTQFDAATAHVGLRRAEKLREATIREPALLQILQLFLREARERAARQRLVARSSAGGNGRPLS